MPVKKISVALDQDVADAASAAAQAHGRSLSSWLNDAARNQLRTERGLAAVQAWEQEHGRLTDDEHTAAEAVLNRLLRSSRQDSV